ncbi:polyprenyl synthetase family protein [Streptomyces sp. NPDC052687]|uniref:polyprenyl synthetase family protein n=1 Tax=Streptomyces sp. NPDC052687 TaxID=3154759 RepID=UPI003434C02B
MTETSAPIENESPPSPPELDSATTVGNRLRTDLERVRERMRALALPPDRRIRPPVAHGLERSGRMLRPALALLSSYLLEERPGVTSQRVIDGAAAVEILHLATLFHDDVIDRAPLRRGRPTVNARYGDSLALLGGDYLLARCMHIAASLGADRLSEMAQTLIDICAGQMIETRQLFDPRRTEEDYFDAIAGKTARLLKAACTTGALAPGATDESAAVLEYFGEKLGMAFQIWDDILDITGQGTGKQPGQDIANGVYTLPVIDAIRACPERLLPLLDDGPPTPEACRELIAVVWECGAVGRAAEVARRHMADALRAVESHAAFAGRAPAIRQQLRSLVGTFASQHPALRVLDAATVGAAVPDSAVSAAVPDPVVSAAVPDSAITAALPDPAATAPDAFEAMART